jgi:hypothetical protein
MNVTRGATSFSHFGRRLFRHCGKHYTPTSIHWTYNTYASSNATAKAIVKR